MNPLESSEMTKSQLLKVDELSDQLESSIRKSPGFDVESFLTGIEDQIVEAAVRSEWKILQQNFASAKTVTGIHCGSETLAEQVRSFKPGFKIDGFELLEPIGRGATAVVWKARSLSLNRSVALKFPTVFSPAMASRLQRESLAVARLQHPNIAAIYEIRMQEKGAYLVSELVEGSTLQSKIVDGGLSEEQAVEILLPIAEAIAYSHSMNVIHRDLKPQNVLVRENGTPVVVDFGLARILQSELVVLTQEGDFIGTPGYMAPEQALGTRNVDERIDVYSLGVIMFQLLTGALPFGGDMQSILHKIVNEPAPVPSSFNRAVSQDLDTICHRCMEKDPANRFESAQELAMELRRFQNGEPILSRPVSSLEKAVRWARKKPLEATLASLLLATLILLALGATLFGVTMKGLRDDEIALRVKAEQAEQEAVKLANEVEQALNESQLQREIAKSEAFENRSTVNFLKSVFQDSNPAMWVLKGDGIDAGKPPSLKQLFENAASRLENEYTGNDRSKANLMETLADSCRSIGNFELARRLLATAKGIREESTNVKSNSSVVIGSESNSDGLNNQFLFARLEHDCGNYVTAEKLYLECLAFREANATTRDRQLSAEAAFHLGRLQLAIQKNKDAKKHFEASLKTLLEIGKKNSFLAKACRVGLEFCDLKPGEVPSAKALAEFFKDDSWAREVVDQFSQILILRASGNYSKAASVYKKFLDSLREKLPEENQWYILALGDYAGLQHRAGYFEEAFRAAKIAISKGEKMAPNHPQLIHAKRKIGKELCRSGDCRTAYTYLKSVYELKRNLATKTSKVEIDKDLYFELVRCCIERDEFEEAQQYVDELKNGSAWVAEPEKVWLAFLESRAFEKSDHGRSANAFKYAISILDEMEEAPNNGIWCHRMAEVLVDDNQIERAIFFAEAAVGFDSKRFFDLHPRVANRRVLLAKIYLLNGQTAKAEEQYELALKSRKRFLSPENRLVIETKRALDSVKESL